MMPLSTAIKALCVITFLALQTGCENMQEGTYRGGVLIQPRPLGIEDQYAFRFVDKWRISHAWLSGAVDIDYCRYSHRDKALGEDRFLEVDGVLNLESASEATKDKGRKFIWQQSERIYGTSPRTGEFKGYLSYCTHTFQDIWTGPSVFLLKPDPAKGTDAWIDGAKPVVVNGLHWLRKDIPIEDYSQNHKQWAAPIEIWVLKIPETPYWFVMRLGGSTGGTGTAPGSNRNPAKYAQVVDLFHQMLASVKLEPITPVDISTLSIKPTPLTPTPTKTSGNKQ